MMMKKEKELIVSKDFKLKMILGKWESSECKNYKYVFNIKETDCLTENRFIIRAKKLPLIDNKEKSESIVNIDIHLRDNFLYFKSSAIGNGHFPILQNTDKLRLHRDTAFSLGYIDEGKNKTFIINFHKV